MSVKFVCERCGKRLRAPEESRGRRARCPGCEEDVLIPAAAVRTPDVFLSYSSHDLATVEFLAAALERAGVRCWMAPRDIQPGADYGEAIVEAISICQLVVLVFSAAANHSPQVKREIERAASKDKAVLPFSIDATKPTKAMEYFLSSAHWLDASTPPLDRHVQLLVRAISDRLTRGGNESSRAVPVRPAGENPPAPASPVAAPTPRGPSSELVGTWQEALKAGELRVEFAYDDDTYVRRLAAILVEDLRARDFSEADCKKTAVAFQELLSNLRHVPDPEKRAAVRIYFGPSEVHIDIADRGPGFHLTAALNDLFARLDRGEREHGLVRALRYGTRLEQHQGPPHTIAWQRERRPAALASMFDDAFNAVPVVFDYDTFLVRIVTDLYHFQEVGGSWWTDGRQRLFFEPLRRTAAPYVGLEVRGDHSTVGGSVESFISDLWTYMVRQLPGRQVVLFANTEASDHDWLRALCEGRITDVYPEEWLQNRFHWGKAFLEISRSGAFHFFEIPDRCVAFLKSKGR